MTWVDMVREFHAKHGQPIADKPGLIGLNRSILRADLIVEEADETAWGMTNRNLVEIADGLADTIYVCIGAALEYGIDLDAVFKAVHESNMTKTPGNLRSDGKVTKGPDFVAPRIAEALGLK